MKVRNRRGMNSGAIFAADEHLWVQKKIENRAYALWRVGGCRQMDGLNDFRGTGTVIDDACAARLQAEREILEEFLPTLFGSFNPQGVHNQHLRSTLAEATAPALVQQARLLRPCGFITQIQTRRTVFKLNVSGEVVTKVALRGDIYAKTH